ncbi:MAG: hypothetical protein JWQ35_1081 [Bacteriovoracaceae bacterium]|nr:hypothetical protein [Bacteriovoracaceae bacterium]
MLLQVEQCMKTWPNWRDSRKKGPPRPSLQKIETTRRSGTVLFVSSFLRSAGVNDLDKSLRTEVISLNTTYRAKLLCTHKAKTHILVAITRMVVVPIRRTQVLRIIVPGAAPKNTVRAKYDHYAKFNDLSNSFRRSSLVSA